MTFLESITEAYLLAAGKSTLPAVNSAKYNKLVGFGIKSYRDWQVEKDADWDSLYDVVSAGTVTATDEFSIATPIIKISQRPGDYIRIVTVDDEEINYKLIPASRLYSNRYRNVVAKVGTKLKFPREFTSEDREFGGIIQVPAYVKLADLSSGSMSAEILIDNPAWHSTMTAAQYVLTDAQLNYKYPDLIAQAAELMTGMKLANEPQDQNYVDDDNHFEVGMGTD